jgi:hypothetical protein
MADEIIAIGEATGDVERMFSVHDHRTPTVWQLGDGAAVTAGLTEGPPVGDRPLSVRAAPSRSARRRCAAVVSSHVRRSLHRLSERLEPGGVPPRR